MTDFNIPCPINVIQVLYHFGNQGLISSYQPELDQHQPLDILASYPFSKIEIEPESDPEPHVSDSISLFDSIITPVSLPDFFSIPESTLNPVPVHCEIESPISYDHTSFMGKWVNINFLV